ncbi:hypothetical protein J6590_058390 [Homalodisca vitripennis]|nr:hypothetical protein J6590_058390 [Homalodisca vitripennis]
MIHRYFDGSYPVLRDKKQGGNFLEDNHKAITADIYEIEETRAEEVMELRKIKTYHPKTVHAEQNLKPHREGQKIQKSRIFLNSAYHKRNKQTPQELDQHCTPTAEIELTLKSAFNSFGTSQLQPPCTAYKLDKDETFIDFFNNNIKDYLKNLSKASFSNSYYGNDIGRVSQTPFSKKLNYNILLQNGQIPDQDIGRVGQTPFSKKLNYNILLQNGQIPDQDIGRVSQTPFTKKLNHNSLSYATENELQEPINIII